MSHQIHGQNGRRSHPNPPSTGVESHATHDITNGNDGNFSMAIVDEMQEESESRIPGIHSTPDAESQFEDRPSELQLTAERNERTGSSGDSSTQYSLGSGHKKKQSFQELMTESIFTKKRGSPNTLTL